MDRHTEDSCKPRKVGMFARPGMFATHGKFASTKARKFARFSSYSKSGALTQKVAPSNMRICKDKVII